MLDSHPPPGIAPRFLGPPGFAWGAIQPQGSVELRYGVSAPEGAGRRGQVLILPDPDEPAEVWFETASALNQAGHVVWLLEWGAYGGSGRQFPPYDMVHAETATAGPQVIAALIAHVIAPAPDAPMVLIASGHSATNALKAAQLGAPATAVILSAPQWATPRPPRPWERAALRVGLGRLPFPDWRPWSRAESERVVPVDADPWRGRLIHSWRLANPDLRQSGVSLGWRVLMTQSQWTGLPDTPAVVRLLVLSDRPDGAGSPGHCQSQNGCRLVVQPDLGRSPHLATDPVRDVWLAEIMAFLGERPAVRRPIPPDASPIE